jgi:hypothetical protein
VTLRSISSAFRVSSRFKSSQAQIDDYTCILPFISTMIAQALQLFL